MEMHNLKTIRGLYQAIKEIADATTPDLTLRQVLVLLSVGYRTSPPSQTQLAEQHDMLKSTLSKIIANLAGMTGDVKRGNGLGMLTVDMDPSDLRGRLVRLSKDGERVLGRACKALN